MEHFSIKSIKHFITITKITPILIALDVIDDPDGYDGLVFNRWYADMCRQGIPIDWHEFI